MTMTTDNNNVVSSSLHGNHNQEQEEGEARRTQPQHEDLSLSQYSNSHRESTSVSQRWTASSNANAHDRDATYSSYSYSYDDDNGGSAFGSYTTNTNTNTNTTYVRPPTSTYSTSAYRNLHRIDPYHYGFYSHQHHQQSVIINETKSPTTITANIPTRSLPQQVLSVQQSRHSSHHLLHNFHHPLQYQATHHHAQISSYNNGPHNASNPYYTNNNTTAIHGSHDAFSQPQGLSSAVLHTLHVQGRRFAHALASKNIIQEIITAITGYNKTNKLHKHHPSISNTTLILNLLLYTIPVIILIFISPTILKSSHHSFQFLQLYLDRKTQHPEFTWHPNRKLNNRKCVLNLFIEKQAKDEFNPDYVEYKPGEVNKDGTPKLPTPPKLEPGTYRTVGQHKIIDRFISSVADSFRSNIHVQQHLLFTGTRDGGHLANAAMKHWPPRGSYQTQIHIIADDVPSNVNITTTTTTNSDLALEYGSLSLIEERFQYHPNSRNVHIYDSRGGRAGLLPNNIDDDDLFRQYNQQMFGIHDDEFDDDDYNDTNNSPNSIQTIQAVNTFDDDTVLSQSTHHQSPDYISIKKLLASFLYHHNRLRKLQTQNSNGNTNVKNNHIDYQTVQHIIPYFHVDGTSASKQLDILGSARPLLQDNIIVTVGVEHSPDMDVNQLIEFFNSVNYKTFFLGLRQITRIDHVCPEILDQIMSHPYITPHKPTLLQKFLRHLKLIPMEKDKHIVHPHPDHKLLYPPFFVAMPRGRHSKEEMTIQHMYDLFGGSGGGGQVQTANDRKAPGKAKKK